MSWNSPTPSAPLPDALRSYAVARTKHERREGTKHRGTEARRRKKQRENRGEIGVTHLATANALGFTPIRIDTSGKCPCFSHGVAAEVSPRREPWVRVSNASVEPPWPGTGARDGGFIARTDVPIDATEPPWPATGARDGGFIARTDVPIDATEPPWPATGARDTRYPRLTPWANFCRHSVAKTGPISTCVDTNGFTPQGVRGGLCSSTA